MLKNPIRTLAAGDEAELLALCARDPISNVFVAGRVESLGCDPVRLGGQLWGYFHRNTLVSACWSGANLIPVEATPETADAFAVKARRASRRAVSIVGPAAAVLPMWDRLRASWGPARDVRPDQPLMLIDRPAQVVPDPAVRLVNMTDLETVLPAAIAMFTEEVGYSPLGGDGGLAYRHRVAELVGGRRTYASFTHPDPSRRRVVFKADLGAVSRRAVQVQGVWVNPEFRGQGLSAAGMAAVVTDCHRRGMAGVSLYVNEFNHRAIRAYERVGFRQVGTFATVLF